MQRIVINGIPSDYISAMDRGLHYGDGIFETIACVENRLQLWPQHMDRMRVAADKLGIVFPGESVFLHDLKSVLDTNAAERKCVIKLMLTRGVGERGYRVPTKPLSCRIVIKARWPEYISRVAERGARIKLCDTQVSMNPQLAGIKHLNRLDNVLARNEWQDEFDEGLMADNQSNIVEGTMSNVFAVRDSVLYTPLLTQCGVNGIIRQQLINMAAELNIPLQEKNISQNELTEMDEIMLTNSIIGIWPVTEFAGNTFETGQLTRLLDKELARRVTDYA